MWDENRPIDNRIILPYVTDALKHSMHMTQGIQKIQRLTQTMFDIKFVYYHHIHKK